MLVSLENTNLLGKFRNAYPFERLRVLKLNESDILLLFMSYIILIDPAFCVFDMFR